MTESRKSFNNERAKTKIVQLKGFVTFKAITISIPLAGDSSKPRDGTADKQTTHSNQKWLHCITCKSPFASAWDLMVHVQTAHMLNIYLLADTNKLVRIHSLIKELIIAL